ncbi:hypothetical protein E6W36_08775 [Hankyongella ginsenosidimutans]|uniref:DUF2946 domain-containing protein n=1 Tax=Hankyongella ginsenosidimutans TaxID=1763828 RepID=A0A4D7C3E1_9SPHN|nr:hypothetical protein [Hankyongella ginsenosidimutans]QCI79601.1 hypothetical protein E6W36_08775 [Hankyongella ginsenosidimutans]
MTNRTASWSLSRWLAMFAILLKIVLAPGTMLAAAPAGGLMVTLCTSDGLASGWISADGKLHRDAPGKAHHEDTPCAFSALSAAALDAGFCRRHWSRLRGQPLPMRCWPCVPVPGSLRRPHLRPGLPHPLKHRPPGLDAGTPVLAFRG